MTLRIQENIPLAPLTTLGVGGPARFFADLPSEDEVLDALAFARARDVPAVIVGGGSNLLVSDEGFPGAVFRVALRGVEAEDMGGAVRMRAAAGEDWDGFVRRCVESGLHGVECLSGVPGWVGGTPVQNVGAYGQEVSGVISAVRVLDRTTGSIVEMTNADCAFGYRRSLFNTTERGRWIVLRVDYRLPKAGQPSLEYPDLARAFAGHETPTLLQVREAVRAIRRSKAMLLVEGDPDCRSAGSFFRNPVVDRDALGGIEAAAARHGALGAGEAAPRFEAGAGRIKVPAAWLIERSGFGRGFGRGAVGLSRRHVLALVNRGGARAREILDLAGEIQEAVESRFHVRLQTEPAFLGFPDPVLSRFGAVEA